jgi:catechol 2,3-dioxygenase-like lactoylglutathione lyase family enzyme
MEKIICGIQQMGIGVPNVPTIWKWYREHFGMDVRIFEEAAEAPLMTRYTGGVVHARTATLALSMEGGGGFEIWQFTSRPTEKSNEPILLGDYGLYACRIKSHAIHETYAYLKNKGVNVLSEPKQLPDGTFHFMLLDPNGNIFDVVESKDRFMKTSFPGKTGGVAGAMIGVSSIEKALPLYQQILSYDKIVYDITDTFDAFQNIPNGNQHIRRVLLSHSAPRKGPFAKLLGPTQLELIQAVDRTDAKSIFKNRFWGDWGFIHLCFDVQGMDALQQECERMGYPFTVDSGKTFDMGEAGGRFSYIEDPDGTWIEFVETHKVPVLKKLGWYIHLKNKKPGQFLPNWMLRTMRFNRVKD